MSNRAIAAAAPPIEPGGGLSYIPSDNEILRHPVPGPGLQPAEVDRSQSTEFRNSMQIAVLLSD